MIYTTNDVVKTLALMVARGAYQRRLAEGDARASGSDETGVKATRSREAWLERCERVGIYIGERTISGRRYIVLATDADDAGRVEDEDLERLWK